MAEYINLDNALERLLFSMCGTGYQYEARHAISSMPTIDIVFCEDCTLHCHCSTEENFIFSGINTDKAFCCVGKRKENDNG